MDRAKPPEQTDWIDHITGLIVLVTGSAGALVAFAFFAIR